MASVNLQSNPDTAIAGTRDADAVIITSDIVTSNLVNYQIEKIVSGDVVNINSDGTGIEGGNVVDVNKTALKIILEFRTRYRVRTKAQFATSYGEYVNFTTRDKRYQSPEAITQLTDDTDATAQTQGTKVGSGGVRIAQGGNRTIVVTNSAKATEADNATLGYNQPRVWGAATVTNTDTIFNDGQLQATGNLVQHPIDFTDRGATILNVPSGVNAPIVYTDRGATITTTRS